MLCLLLVVTSVASAQGKKISGLVTSQSDGQPVIGATILVVGANDGTVTDLDGKFSISVPSNQSVLKVSFIGMESKEVTVGSQTYLKISLDGGAVNMDEVVVTAFGITREKKSVTYQTETVSNEDLTAGKAVTAAQGLVGKVAGLQVNVQSSGVNPSTQILLRGFRSVSGNNEALIVIDGVVASSGAFDALNPEDIESTNVLKGGTAAALYGSSAANGALIVTTKKGQSDGRFTVGFTNTSTFESVAYMPDFQSKFGIGWDGQYDRIENTSWGDRFDGTMREIGPTFADGSSQVLKYAPIEDNLKDFYNTGTTYQNTIYASGGDKTGSFYMSLGNQRTKGIVPDDTYKRNTFTVNADKKLGKLKLSTNISYYLDETDVVGDQIGDQDRSFNWFVLNTQPNIPLTSYSDWEDPSSYAYADNYYNAYYQNPYWVLGTNRDTDVSNRLRANMAATYDILDNLNFSVRGGVNSTNQTGQNWRAAQTYDSALQPSHSDVSSFVEDTKSNATTYNFDALLQGDFQLKNNFTLKTIVGANSQAYEYDYAYMRANNLSIEGWYDVANGTGETQVTRNHSEKRTFGFFADVTLGYQNWAYLNLTGRQDYTSTLAKGDNGYFYPAFGGTVILTEALSALKDNNVLSMLKLTANNSTVYNDLAAYQLNERYFQSSNDRFGFPYGSTNGFEASRESVDAGISKEKINSTEFSLNSALYKGRITFDATYYITKTTDNIVQTTPSYSSGSTSMLTNIGLVRGTGYEFSLGANIIDARDFKWDVNFNYTHYENIIEEIGGGLTEIALDVYDGFGTYAIEGEAFSQLKAVAYSRDDEGHVIVDAVSGNPVVGDLEVMGKTTPDHILGLTTAFSYKGLRLSATMDYRAGFIYYSQGSDIMEFTGRSMESVQANREDFVWANSVINTGTESAPVYTENTNVQITGGQMSFWKDHYNQIKENYIKNGDSFKLRELSLSYQLPQELLSRTNVISKVSLGLVARNVFTVFTKEEYKFSDPEFRNTRSTDNVNGVGIGGYLSPPPTRSLGFTLNVEL